MGQLILILVVIAVGWLLWRSVGSPAVRRRPPPAATSRPKATPLERDPETGVYRPVEREERPPPA